MVGHAINQSIDVAHCCSHSDRPDHAITAPSFAGGLALLLLGFTPSLLRRVYPHFKSQANKQALCASR